MAILVKAIHGFRIVECADDINIHIFCPGEMGEEFTEVLRADNHEAVDSLLLQGQEIFQQAVAKLLEFVYPGLDKGDSYSCPGLKPFGSKKVEIFPLSGIAFEIGDLYESSGRELPEHIVGLAQTHAREVGKCPLASGLVPVNGVENQEFAFGQQGRRVIKSARALEGFLKLGKAPQTRLHQDLPRGTARAF